MMPAPIAIRKPENTSPMISASPVCLMVTPGGRFLAVGVRSASAMSVPRASEFSMLASTATRTARS